jgi:hypothetical protein
MARAREGAVGSLKGPPGEHELTLRQADQARTDFRGDRGRHRIRDREAGANAEPEGPRPVAVASFLGGAVLAALPSFIFIH